MNTRVGGAESKTSTFDSANRVDDLIAVLEAMKMENPVTGLSAQPGDLVSQGTTLCELKD
ncbi:hypothetical protein ACWEV3_07240 [Saccharopolyspora sp. NPDC003752]